MDIRRLSPSDLDALIAIRAQFFPEDAGVVWPAREYLTPHGMAVGAFSDGSVVGYAAAGLRSHAEGAWELPSGEQVIAYLEEWFVSPPHRRRGLGRRLLHDVEEWAGEQGAAVLASDTEIDNAGSLAAHLSVGFREVERSIHFVKALTATSAPVPIEAEVSLRPLDEVTGRQVMHLKVAPGQNRFVAPNSVSLSEAFLTSDVVVRGVFAGDEPVGFAMLSTRNQRYYLWRFMIDHRYQGRGYGRRAMELVIDLVRELPGSAELRLSCVDAPGGPRPFYESLGFRNTGEIHDGEHVMVRPL